MKKTLCCVLIFFHYSCFDSRSDSQKIEQLEERVKRLEEKLEGTQSTTTMPFGTGDFNTATYNGNCQAITKKGRQCRRKAKSNGYCWQHGR